MAFPTVVGSVAETAVSTAGTSHVINLPSLAAGNLCIILLNRGVGAGTFNTLSGWTELLDEATVNGMTIWYRLCDGSEGATVTFTSTGSTRSAALAYEISGAADPAVQAPQLSTIAVNTNTSPNATTCTPTGGAKDYLWISFFGCGGEEADDDTWCTAAPATPSAFSNLVQKACGIAGSSLGGIIAAAQLASNASSMDAGAFTLAASLSWRAYTMAIHPASDPPVGMKQPFLTDTAALRY